MADVRRRVRRREFARGLLVAAGVLLAGLLGARAFGAGWRGAIVSAFGLAGAALAGWLLTRRSAWREPALLSLAESRQPAFRNLLVTARELTRHPDRATPVIRQRVLRDAARVAHETPIDAIVPLHDARRALAGAAVLCVVGAVGAYALSRSPGDLRGPSSAERGAGGTAGSDAASGARGGSMTLTAIITPPPYTGRPAVTLRDPARIDALAGSRLRIDVVLSTSATGTAHVAQTPQTEQVAQVAQVAQAAQAVQAAQTVQPVVHAAFNERTQRLEALGTGDNSGNSSRDRSSDGSRDRSRDGAGSDPDGRRFRGDLLLTDTGVLTITVRDATATAGATGDATAAGTAASVAVPEPPASVLAASPTDREAGGGTATTAGNLAAAASTGQSAETTRVIAVTVTPDQAPVVELTTPGRDLLFDEAGTRVEFVARARDDLGVATLGLRYTKVSGSGEQYEFHEGELPLAIARTDPRQWQGRVTRALGDLQLHTGDLFVYYAVAQDARGEPGRAVSDSYVIEIGKPGVAIAGGFAIPPDEDRFAISLNALIQKTERLHAKRAAMPAPEFADAALALAVEQRMVKTEFLFTMGFHGHVQDEEVEAEHSHEIQEGRLENRGQAEMALATRLMTWAEQQLTAADTGEALKAMRGALAAIQRALSRHRYFLRTLLTSTEIDPSRRLTGDLSAASPARWPARDRTPDARLARIRAVLADLARLASGLETLAASLNGRAAPLSTGGRPNDAHAAPPAPPVPLAPPAVPSLPSVPSPAVSSPSVRSAPSTRETPSSLAALASAVAPRVLALDPSSASLQDAASTLTQASRTLSTLAASPVPAETGVPAAGTPQVGAAPAGALAAPVTTAAVTAAKPTVAERDARGVRESLAHVKRAAASVLTLAATAAPTSQASAHTPSDSSLRGAFVDAQREAIGRPTAATGTPGEAGTRAAEPPASPPDAAGTASRPGSAAREPGGSSTAPSRPGPTQPATSAGRPVAPRQDRSPRGGAR